MNQKLIEPENLERLMQQNWTKFINPTQLLRRLLEDIRNSDFRKVPNEKILTNQTKVSITKVVLNADLTIEFWVEFAVQGQEGLTVGSNIYLLQNSTTLDLKESCGTVLTYP